MDRGDHAAALERLRPIQAEASDTPSVAVLIAQAEAAIVAGRRRGASPRRSNSISPTRRYISKRGDLDDAQFRVQAALKLDKANARASALKERIDAAVRSAAEKTLLQERDAALTRERLEQQRLKELQEARARDEALKQERQAAEKLARDQAAAEKLARDQAAAEKRAREQAAQAEKRAREQAAQAEKRAREEQARTEKRDREQQAQADQRAREQQAAEKLAREQPAVARGIADVATVDAETQVVVTPRPATRWPNIAAVVALLLALSAGAYYVVTRKATPAPIVNGTAIIDAVPWATIDSIRSADGASVPLPEDAATPLSIPLAPGTYQVTLVGPGPAKTRREVSVTVVAGEAAVVAPPLFATIEAEQYLLRALAAEK